MAHTASIPASHAPVRNVVSALLLLAAVIFLALHAVHLTADFPNHSPWMDWAKYTDEGWYGDAAIRHYQRGHWYVYGDFNPAAALPVFPLLELAVFRFTGVSLVAARSLTVGIFALILVASYLLLRRWRTGPASLAPAAGVLLLAVSPFCFVFTRMAILEPLLVLLTLLALLAASAAPLAFARSGRGVRRYGPAIALGVLLPLMVLTKTTAVFLLPCVLWLLWAAAEYRRRLFLTPALVALGLAMLLWSGYFFLAVRPHFLADYRYLFSANAYTGITLENARKVLHDTMKDGMWMGGKLYPLGMAVSLGALLLLRRHTPPLLVSLLLWVGGYAAFLAYHNNLQPRYYLVVAVPLTLLLPFTTEELLGRLGTAYPSLRAAAWLVAVLVVGGGVLVPDALQTVGYVRKPEYTFVEAAAKVRAIVRDNPSQSPLILSISGSDLSLMTGLPSICDDFGTMELSQRVATYHPGWYVTWNQIDDDKMESLAPLYRPQRVAAIPAFDDPERNLLIVYRLDPRGTEKLRPRRQRPPVPRLLQTELGQQPSTTQLEH